MSHAAAAHTLTPTDVETRLAALGIPVARLIAAAHIARSTWAAWRAGRTQPRPDRWSAVTEAFAALVAEAEAPPAEATGADPVPLAGSSAPTGAPPRFTPIATALTVDAPAGLLPSPRLDATVIAAAERTAELARREWATMGLSVQAEERLSTNPGPAAEIASRAADRLTGRLNRRLRLACRKLARQPATTPAAVAAKAQAVLEVQSTSTSDDWWTALRDSTIRDAAHLGPGPSRQATADPAPSAHLGPESLIRSEGADFAAAAREWAAAELHFVASIEAGASGLDTLSLRLDERRKRFLDIPARTLDGVLAKSLVLSWFIDDGFSGETVPAAYEALRTATLNTAEANLAFPVMQDLAAIAAARGFSVEALDALPTPDVEATPGAGGSGSMTDIAALTAEWVRSCAEDQRDNDTFDMVTKGPDRDAGVARMHANAARHCDLLWRIADLRSTSPDVLALKAAVVLADCRDAAELDTDIARRDGTSFGEAEIAVALSLVRDIGALHGAPVRRLVAAVAAAAELPIAGEAAPSLTRAAA